MSEYPEKPVEQSLPDKKVVVSRVGTNHKKVVLVVVVVLAGIVILIGGGYLLWQKKHARTNVGGVPKGAITQEAPATVEPTSVKAVNDLLARGKSQEASQLVSKDSSLKNSRDGQMLLAQIALNDNKYDDAISIYKGIADKYGWTPNIADQIVQCYELKNDKAGQVTYYQKELELLQKDTTNIARQTEIDRVQAKLKELQS